MTERIEGVYSTPMVDFGRKKISLKTVNKILLFLLFVSGVYYITTINDLVVKGFVLQDLKSKVEFKSEDNRILNARATSLKSCNELAKRIEGLNMVSSDKINYIKVNKWVLAAK